MSNYEPRPTITVCIPAHNEESTVGNIVRHLHEQYQRRRQLIDEVIVVDDRSSDHTAQVAWAAGARVISTVDVCAEFGGSIGKGDAIWASLRACRTELIGWVDADLVSYPKNMVESLFAPLLVDPTITLVKGSFCRMDKTGNQVVGGRVTTLTARPLLEMFFPKLEHLRDPLSGMFAGRTEVLGALMLDADYGVDIGIVLDLAAKYGSESICEVQIGELMHRQRPLNELSAMATMVVRAIVSRVPRAHLTGCSDAAADLEIAHQLVRRMSPRKQTQQLFAIGTGD
ncbi:MAG: glycosyltransferase [Acidimicrobiaceae bacterium]|nr:glycosyltransferase [Acidimicrobiaceae bacterium]